VDPSLLNRMRDTPEPPAPSFHVSASVTLALLVALRLLLMTMVPVGGVVSAA